MPCAGSSSHQIGPTNFLARCIMRDQTKLCFSCVFLLLGPLAVFSLCDFSYFVSWLFLVWLHQCRWLTEWKLLIILLLLVFINRSVFSGRSLQVRLSSRLLNDKWCVVMLNHFHLLVFCIAVWVCVYAISGTVNTWISFNCSFSHLPDSVLFELCFVFFPPWYYYQPSNLLKTSLLDFWPVTVSSAVCM